MGPSPDAEIIGHGWGLRRLRPRFTCSERGDGWPDAPVRREHRMPAMSRSAPSLLTSISLTRNSSSSSRSTSLDEWKSAWQFQSGLW